MSIENSLDVNKILNRLLSLYNLKTDASLARKLEVTPPVLGMWRKRNNINAVLIVEKCSDTDLNQLFYGRPAPATEAPPEKYKTTPEGQALARKSNVKIHDVRALKKQIEEDLAQRLREREEIQEENKRLKEELLYTKGRLDEAEKILATIKITATEKSVEKEVAA